MSKKTMDFRIARGPAAKTAGTMPGRGHVPQKSSLRRNPDEKHQKRKRRILLILLLLLLLGLGTCTAFHFFGEDRAENPTLAAVLPDIDLNAEDITTREEFESSMQEAADANYFTLQVNPEASFSASTGKGSLELINPPSNVYPLTFTLTLDETGDVIYESGAIMPNKQVSEITLDAIPAVGSHQATISVLIFNPDTHEKEGETQAKISLTMS